jgi:hypothetical protein
MAVTLFATRTARLDQWLATSRHVPSHWSLDVPPERSGFFLRGHIAKRRRARFFLIFDFDISKAENP